MPQALHACNSIPDEDALVEGKAPSSFASIQDSAAISATLAIEAENDGVDDLIEDGAPNNGDGNNDGVPDSQQDNVASLPGNGGNYITLVVPESQALEGVSHSETPPTTTVPLTATFPLGFLSFSVTDIEAGGAVTVTILHFRQRRIRLLHEVRAHAGRWHGSLVRVPI